jgi:hypothetical protein
MAEMQTPVMKIKDKEGKETYGRADRRAIKAGTQAVIIASQTAIRVQFGRLMAVLRNQPASIPDSHNGISLPNTDIYKHIGILVYMQLMA